MDYTVSAIECKDEDDYLPKVIFVNVERFSDWMIEKCSVINPTAFYSDEAVPSKWFVHYLIGLANDHMVSDNSFFALEDYETFSDKKEIYEYSVTNNLIFNKKPYLNVFINYDKKEVVINGETISMDEWSTMLDSDDVLFDGPDEIQINIMF